MNSDKALGSLRQVLRETLEAREAERGMGPKIQALYDSLTPFALFIKEIQEESGNSDVTASLVLGFSAIVRNADDLAVAGLIMDLLWKVVDKEVKDHG